VKKTFFLPAACLLLCAIPAAWALDSIKLKKGGNLGTVINAGPLKIEIEQNANSQRKEIPVNQIDAIFFDGEPAPLTSAKNNALNGKFSEALNLLNQIKPDSLKRKELVEDLDYYTAYVSARLAIGGTGKITDAGRLMIAFMKNYPESYHHFQACEIVGDLLAANGSFAQAEEYYAKVALAPWLDYQMRAGNAMGRMLLAQGKKSAALEAFDKILANDAADSSARAQLQAAALGKASVLAAMDKFDEALKLAESVLDRADPDDAAVMARAYNTLGNALRRQGKTKEAALAFLHVDLLYPAVADEHAEALFNLAELWDELHKPDRAAAARQTLQQKYKNSPWAQKAKQ
jgi:tetratricopeptide (TPR) repeat protein